MAKKSNCQECVSDLARVFGMLSDETRLKIVCHLARQEENVGNLCKMLNVAQPTASHHLGLMRLERVINSRRNGKQVIYSLNTEKFNAVMKEFAGVLRGKK